MASEHPERENPDFYHYWLDETVRFHDMDAFGHVNNNEIGVYFETARMRWLNDIHPDGWRKDAHFVLAKTSITFLREILYPNKVRIGKRILRLGNSSMTSCGGVFVNNSCAALCESVSVWIGHTTRRPEPIAAPIRAVLQRYT